MSTPIRGSALWAALSAIAGMITDKTGIKILRGGIQPKTDKKSIWLPSLPDNLLNWRQVRKVLGYLYHECGHVLFSGNYPPGMAPLHEALSRILEDIRIEGAMMRRIPAASKYLMETVQVMVEDGMEGKLFGFKPVPPDAEPSSVLQAYLMYRLRHDVLGQHVIAPVLATALPAIEAAFPKGALVRLEALAFEVRNCQSKDDVIELAAEIVQMIEEEAEKERQEQEQQEQDQQDQQDDGNKGEEQSAPGSQPEGDDDSEAEDNGQSGSSSSGSSGSDEGQDMKGNEEAQQNLNPNAQADVSPEEQQQGSAGAGGQGASSAPSALEKVLAMTEEEIVQGVGEMLKGELVETSQEFRYDPRAVTIPHVHRLDLRQKSVDMVALQGSVNAVRTKTLQWMSSVAECDVQHARSGAMLDCSRLHMARLGGEIFVRQDEGIDLNAAIDILIDRSGSMDEIITQAANAAVATMMAYQVPGIETRVSVFPVSDGLAVVKNWHESARTMAGRIQSLTADGGTPMSEAILWSAASMVRRTETLRLIMVIGDGMPDNLISAREVIESARAQGITVVGLGIGVDVSGVFGPHSAVIREMKDLATAMVQLVKSAFKDQRLAA